MKKRLDLSIGQRLALGFGAATLLLALLVASSYAWTGEVAAARHRLTGVIAPRAAAADRLESASLYMAVAARNYVLMPEPGRLESYYQAARRVRTELQTLSGLPKEPNGLEAFAPIPALVDKLILATESLLDAAGRHEDVRELEPSVAVVREEALGAVRAYASLQRQKLERGRQETADAVERMTRAALALGALVLGLLAITGWLTMRAVRGPALSLVSVARRLAAGDFGPALAITRGVATNEPRRDEIAELTLSFGRMAVDLGARASRLRANASLASGVAASLDVGSLCESGLDVIVSHLGVEVGAVYLVDGARLQRRCALGLAAGEDSVALGEGIPGRAAKTRSTVTSADIPADSPFTVHLGVDALPPKAVVAVPMVLQDRQVAGVILVAGLRPIDAGAIDFLEHAAVQLAVGIQNALAHESIRQLAAELQDKNETLQTQFEEIQAQQEELQSQHEEIQAQNEELQSQNEELQSQREELSSRGEELRRTIDRIHASEERYHSLFTHLSEGSALHEMIYDEAGRPTDYRFLAANAAFEAATGLRADEVVGKTVKEVMPDLDQVWIARYAEVVHAGEPARFEDVSAPLGKVYQVIAFRVGQHQFATLFVDVTDQKRAEEALRDIDRNKNEFLAVLSHELRNPLAPIKNSLYVLARAAPGSEQAKRAQSVIDRQVKQLARLVEDLLDVTRISRGKVQLRKTRVELAKLLRQAAEDNAPEFVERGIELAVEIAAEPAMHGDAARLSQVIGNLLHNAAKFTPGGGRVLLGLEDGDGLARIRVRDTGAGMDGDTLGRLFQPFMQADATLARTNGGLGLGLALVKGLVEMHGGSVRASSDGRGRGAEFVVELPSGAELAMVPTPAAVPPASRRVLVVEDNIDAADSLREALALGGHEVEVAYRGTDGIDKVRAWRPDVVLCDIGLPDIDGHQVARTVRSDPDLGSVFLVALSGYALPEDLKRASDAGFDEHLAKPPSIDRLEELLSKASSSGARVA